MSTVPLSPFLEENERGGMSCLISLGVTGIVDGKSLLQYYFVYTLINKLCQLLFCWSNADLQRKREVGNDAHSRVKRLNAAPKSQQLYSRRESVCSLLAGLCMYCHDRPRI